MIGNGSGGAVTYPWAICFAEANLSGGLGNSVRGHFTIPALQHGLTFGIWCAIRVAGNADVKLRFAWQDFDSDLAVIGVDFPNIALTNITFFRSVVFADGAALPGTDGSSPSMVPPRVSVIASSGAGTDLDYMIFSACVGLF